MTTITIAATALFVFTVSDAFSDAFIFREQRGDKEANKYWHAFQALRQGTVIAAISWLVGSWQLAFLGASIFWFLHDGLVNTVGLNRHWSYVGKTAWIDKQFQKLNNPERAMITAKLTLIGGSALAFFVF